MATEHGKSQTSVDSTGCLTNSNNTWLQSTPTDCHRNWVRKWEQQLTHKLAQHLGAEHADGLSQKLVRQLEQRWSDKSV